MTEPEEQTPSDLERLRLLLLAPEQNEIEAINDRLDDAHKFASDIGDALPLAVRLADKQGAGLANNLTPVVEKVMEKSVRKNPGMMIDILFPIIGSAVRKAAVEMFDTMVQSINQTLENSLSWRSLRWRFEAWRTGKPFAEIVLFYTLLYRVEQVFVIHKDSGLLLHHLSVDGESQGETELVSSMLTAIQDFVRDSFAVDQETPLESLRVGEFQVWIESGPEAYLAVVLRGSVPMSLRQVMRNVLEEIHKQYSLELAAFEGDATPFADAGLVLAPCLRSERKEEEGSKRFFYIFLVVVLGLITWGTTFFVKSQRLATAMHQAVANEPGYHVTNIDKEDGVWQYHGLKDPLARPLEELIAERGLDQAINSQLEPYYALHPDILLRRAEEVLQPPDSVSLELKDGILVMSGEAPNAWLKELPRHSPVPGISRMDSSDLSDANSRGMAAHISKIESFAFYFESGESDLDEDKRNQVRELAEHIKQALGEAKALDAQIMVEVRGFGDQSGSEQINRELSTQRASYILDELIRLNVPPAALRPMGFGKDPQDGVDPTRQRRVICKVIRTDN